jgi:hypothetical protein
LEKSGLGLSFTVLGIHDISSMRLTHSSSAPKKSSKTRFKFPFFAQKKLKVSKPHFLNFSVFR